MKECAFDLAFRDDIYLRDCPPPPSAPPMSCRISELPSAWGEMLFGFAVPHCNCRSFQDSVCQISSQIVDPLLHICCRNSNLIPFAFIFYVNGPVTTQWHSRIVLNKNSVFPFCLFLKVWSEFVICDHVKLHSLDSCGNFSHRKMLHLKEYWMKQPVYVVSLFQTEGHWHFSCHVMQLLTAFSAFCQVAIVWYCW